MDKQPMSIEEIQAIGMEALNKALGPVGAIRFLEHIGKGQGDYAEDRHAWQDQESVEDIFKAICERKKSSDPQ